MFSAIAGFIVFWLYKSWKKAALAGAAVGFLFGLVSMVASTFMGFFDPVMFVLGPMMGIFSIVVAVIFGALYGLVGAVVAWFVKKVIRES